MSRAIPLVLALLVAGPAHAAETMVQAQVSMASVRAPAFESFARDALLPTYGVRGNLGVTKHLAVVGGLHAGRRGLVVSDQVSNVEQFRTSYTATTLLLGAQLETRASDYFSPYILAGALGHLGHSQFDDDPTRREHPGQLRSTAIAPGATAAVGGTIFMASPNSSVRPTLHAELGWQGVLTHRYAEAGDRMLPLGYSGVAFRTGLGVAF